MSLAYWLEEGPAEPVEEGTIQFGPGKGLPKLVFNGLDGSRNRVRKIATLDPVRKKIILIQPGDKALYLSGLREAGIPGYLYLFAHARPDRIQGAVDIHQIVNVVRRSGFWHGQPAVGQGAFEKLPGVLSGIPFPNILRPGEWRTWGPDGQPIASTRTSPRDKGRPLTGTKASNLLKSP